MNKLKRALKAHTIDFYKFTVLDMVNDCYDYGHINYYGKYFLGLIMSIIIIPSILVSLLFIPLLLLFFNYE